MEAAACEDDLLPVSRNDLSNSGGKNTPSKERPSLLGIGLLFLSGLLFTTLVLFVKLLKRITAIEAAQVRSSIQFVIASPFVLYCVGGSPLGPKTHLPWVLARGFFGISSATCSYYAVKHMPVGDATVLVFTSPVFTGIISRLVLKEAWGLWEASASVLSITGVVFIAHPSFLFEHGRKAEKSGALQRRNSSQSYNFNAGSEQHVGQANLMAVGMALAAAVLMACAVVAARKASQKVHYLIVTMYDGGVGIVFTLIFSLATTQKFVLPYSLRESVFMLAIGWLGFTAQVTVNKGLAIERAAVGALVRNVDVVAAFVYQVAVFGDSVTAWSALGTFFILSATLSIAWKRYREQLRTGTQ